VSAELYKSASQQRPPGADPAAGGQGKPDEGPAGGGSTKDEGPIIDAEVVDEKKS
jgi:hypothetical protein